MPIYEYKCSACEHQLEVIQKMSDSVLVHCPECQQETLKKQLSAAAFRLTGTGWYETDFKHSGKQPDNKESTDKKSDKQPENKTAKPAKPGKESKAAATSQASATSA